MDKVKIRVNRDMFDAIVDTAENVPDWETITIEANSNGEDPVEYVIVKAQIYPEDEGNVFERKVKFGVQYEAIEENEEVVHQIHIYNVHLSKTESVG